MSKLIVSAVIRLTKRIIFWIFLIGMFAYGAFMVFAVGSQNIEGNMLLEGCFWGFAPIMGMISAIFVSLFIGAEYSDGTIRNKLIVGHKRTTIYMSNLVVCSIANVLFCLAYIVAVMAFGNMQNGTFAIGYGRVIFLTICGLLATISFTSIMTLLAMTNKNKSVNVVISMLLALALLASGATIYQSLCEPEQYDQYISVDSNGVPTEVDRLPNPQYIDGTQRQVYEILSKCLPSGQSIQLADMFNSTGENTSQDFSRPTEWPFYSVGIVFFTTVVGMAIFKRKEIK